MNNGALVRLVDVHKIYRTGEMEVAAVRGVSLEIKCGEFVALMGASGSGKSTLMNILGCLDRPTTGHYLLDGADVSGLDRDRLADIRNRKIGFVFQNFICCRVPLRARMSSCPWFTAHSISQMQNSAKRPIASWYPSDSQVAKIITRASFQVASNNAWRSRAR
jgi:predicted ABC-type transport system involved in lysophospholipase L1 biosynthesis ATPase subunit